MHRFLLTWMLSNKPHDPGGRAVLPAGRGRKVLVTGGSGFIGKPLVNALLARRFSVLVLTRNPGRARRGIVSARAYQEAGQLRYVQRLDDIASDQQIDLIINLAGESLNTRWTAKRKAVLLDSRVRTTEALAALVARLEVKPTLLISGSAVGYFGPQAEAAPLEEEAPWVDSFSHQLCAQWEDAASEIRDQGVRVCIVRLGVVLGRRGGALLELLRSFVFGVAAPLGSGQQWLSWVHMDDVLSAIGRLICNGDSTGVYNLTAPKPVTNEDFVQCLAARLRTWLRLPLPAPVVRALFGEMGDELLLSGQRVVPARLQSEGFVFGFPTLDDALTDILGRS